MKRPIAYTAGLLLGALGIEIMAAAQTRAPATEDSRYQCDVNQMK